MPTGQTGPTNRKERIMAFLIYQDGKKEFTPLIITVESPESLSALYSVASKAEHCAETYGLVTDCANEMMKAIKSHAEENGVIITVTA